jgi:AmiR/NasT family two-component response regulator
VIKKAAEEKLGKWQQVQNEWFDQECRVAIEDKNRARGIMMQRETRGNCERYKQLRQNADRICKATI